ncbi:hypothetical protein F9K91_21210 [Brucella tritici]|uniref:Winged helix-turn-helix domain-containing protein n=2 Tax=Brucella tritici TaxID=94626 RepID=A0A833FM03_9HYPH|nr:helix-turn-helix domain-containing protein [Brucella tritici]KAB2662757.1 hypothetical protein F9K91_21210 [Brucella tritici]
MQNHLTDATVYNLSPQQRTVYDYLMSGRELTRQVAINTLHVQEVTTRISELRRLGLDIKSEWKRDFGGTRYKSYHVEMSK